MSHTSRLGLSSEPQNGTRPELWLGSTEPRAELAQAFFGLSYGRPESTNPIDIHTLHILSFEIRVLLIVRQIFPGRDTLGWTKNMPVWFFDRHRAWELRLWQELTSLLKIR